MNFAYSESMEKIKTSQNSFGVIGGGAWGTALATLLASQGHDTLLWAYETTCSNDINSNHMNSTYLDGAVLSKSLRATSDLADLSGRDIILCVVPAQHTRGILKQFRPYSRAGQAVVLCSKGIETGTLSLMTDVLLAELPDVIPAVLSGPSFAIDVAKGLPTAVTLACADPDQADKLAHLLSAPTFRPYTSTDLIGAEIGGAIKNVLAIACGIVLGMGLGRSAHAALIARGFAEMTRLGEAMGANPATLTGLCGLGDLVLTCSSQQSRNMSCGFALGEGENLEDFLKSRNVVVEGVGSAPAVLELACQYNVDMPICTSVAGIVAGTIDAKTAVLNLLNRPLKAEQGE